MHRPEGSDRETRTGPDLSPYARTAGAFAAAFVIAVAVNLIVAGLTYMQFGPLLFVEEFDNRFYTRLSPPPITASNIHRIVFVDIDNAAMRAAMRGQAPTTDTRTPRRLLATMIQKIRDSGASVLFLDIDLRVPARDDDLLLAALRATGPPVLLPQFITGDANPQCIPGSQALFMPMAFRAPFVYPVHGMLEQAPFGMVAGLCSSYQNGPDSERDPPTIFAAMWAAVKIARTSGHSLEPLLQPPVVEVPITWRLTPGMFDFPPDKQVKVFYRIPATLLIKFADTDLSIFNGSIVIVGSTHDGSELPLRTPIGDMPGALVHANAALSIQDPGPEEPIAFKVFHWGVEIFVLPLIAGACWWAFFRNPKSEGESTLPQRGVRLVQELLLTIGLWPILTAVGALLGAILYGYSGALRFGALGFFVRVGLVVAIESISALAERSERSTRYWVQGRINNRRSVGNADASAVETEDNSGSRAESDHGND
jgi:CHASE2 domain-containing sensor protein